MSDDKYDNDPVLSGPVFGRETLDNAPRHDHGCGLPHVDERCPRDVMVKLLRPNAGDGLFAKYNQANRQAIHDHFRLSPNLLQGRIDMNDATTHESVGYHHARLLGSRPALVLYGAVDGLESMAASEVSARATIAAQTQPRANNVVVLDADYEAMLESGGDCRVTIVHPEVLAGLAEAMGDAMRNADTGIQCDEHDLFTDDDGVQRCAFCMATQEEIDAYEAMMQAQAYEATYGLCEHCGAFDDDVHDANCPRRPCTEEEDAAHESRFDDPGRHSHRPAD